MHRAGVFNAGRVGVGVGRGRPRDHLGNSCGLVQKGSRIFPKTLKAVSAAKIVGLAGVSKRARARVLVYGHAAYRIDGGRVIVNDWQAFHAAS